MHFKPDRRHIASGIAGAALAVALIGGATLTRDLIESGAGVRAMTASERNGILQAQARAHPAKRTVPYFGPFALDPKKGTRCGPAVRIMSGALRRTIPPVRKAKASNCVGVAMAHQIAVFQKRHHIPATGVYGKRTHLALTPRYSTAQREGLIYIARLEVIRKERATVLTVTAHAITVGGGSLAYCQGASRSFFPGYPRLPPCTDCSGFAVWVLYQSGVGDRVGYPPTVGWTGTLSKQGRYVPVSLTKLAIGDLIFFGGGYPYGHVEVYIGHGLTVGHGSVGVHLHSWTYRRPSAVRRFIF